MLGASPAGARKAEKAGGGAEDRIATAVAEVPLHEIVSVETPPTLTLCTALF